MSTTTGDDSQIAVIRISGLGPALTVTTPPSMPPATVQPRVLRHVVPVLAPRPALTGGRPGSPWRVEHATDVPYGTPHVYIDGVDVTFLRDVPIRIDSLTFTEPFGDGPAQFALPGATPLDVPGAGDLAWCHTGAQVEVWVVLPDGRLPGAPWWCGFVVSIEPTYGATSAAIGVQCAGALWQADQIRHRVPLALADVDIGTVIPQVLNAIPGRKYAPIAQVVTGITTSQRGSDTTEVGYVQGLLATATTDDGASQWTITRLSGARRYALAVKDVTTVHVTLVAGQPGLSVGTLARDATAAPNALYGTGVGTDGYGWAGWAYPNLLPDDAPPYPYASAATVMNGGSTDAGTVGGRGVSTWQARAVALGYVTRVDGTFSASDAAAARAIQRARGLSVDGAVGPQTWAATFDVGSNGGDLSGAVRLPLAFDPRIEPTLYAANGAAVGANPRFDPSILRVEADTAYGAGISKATARRSALAQLARLPAPGWAGTLTLTLDPPEMSRFDIRPGMNVQLTGWAGVDLLLHVASTTITDTQSVSLTVDTAARDALTLAAVISRDNETTADLARRPGKRNATSSTTSDTIVDFDGESGAGVIPRHAVYQGLWNVLRIPVSQAGRIAKFVYATDSPAVRFSLALFGAAITPADLMRLVGDPLNDPDDGDLAPYVKNLDELNDTWGFIEAFGQGETGAGYYPGNPGDDNAVTGRMVETSAIEFVSAQPPWIWVAEWAPTSTFASGRLYPAPQGT